MFRNQTQQNIDSKFTNSDQFFPYIEEIRFPMYKSLVEDTRLPLDWPIVALVGPNGTNKSSVLQAISAAPEGRSLAQFWFSTAVDDIDSGIRGKASHRFIYKYRFARDGLTAECRKYRGSKQYRANDVPKALIGKRDPDYWEPTKRVAGDSMAPIPQTGYDEWLSNNRDRWNQVKKNVLYLDFRAELSAFDKYIHHQSFDHWASDSTQKRYRVVQRSKWIAKALSGKTLPKAQRHKLVQKVRLLPESDVATIARILGKPISKISMIEHRFFGPTGFTVRLHLADSEANYSEAHAGSGEYAVVRLVDAIRRAAKRSLILLDEPEVSLHPGAQAELLEFIEREVLQCGHQVVFSTHSPSLAAGLPSRAIKVFGVDAKSQRVTLVADGCSPTEAFAHLGHITSAATRPRLIVEDDLAREIVRASLRKHAPAKLDSLEIRPIPGGADGIIRNVLSSLALTDVEKCGVLLDGDQLPESHKSYNDIKDEAELAVAKDDIRTLKRLWIDNYHKTSPNLYSNTDGNLDTLTLFTLIRWSGRHLGFLPGRSPEQALAEAVHDKPEAPDGWKAYWENYVANDIGFTPKEVQKFPDDEVLATQRRELARLPRDSIFLKRVHETIDRIIDW